MVFIAGMVISTLIKDSLREKLKIKTEVSSEELKQMVAVDAIEYAKTLNPDVDLTKVQTADLYFFKNGDY